MVNREYLKSRIDSLPDESLIVVDKFIDKKIRQNNEKIKHNNEYLEKIDKSLQQLKNGESVTFEWEEFEAMTKMPFDEAKSFCEKIKKSS